MKNQKTLRSNNFSLKMNRKVLNTEEENSVKLCASMLSTGEVVGLPTDTIYGLACNANDPKSIQRLYAIKGRNENKPVAICVGEIKDVRHWGEADHLSDELLNRLLPGPVTIVLHKSENLDNPYLNPGVDKIGIRIPDFDFIRNICRKSQFPIALTSANKSSENSTLRVEEFKHLWPSLGGVFDGGCLGKLESQRAGSTVIDLSEHNSCYVIRKGVAIDQVSSVLKEFDIDIKN